MKTINKARWLQKYYGNYPLHWYLRNLKRLEAMFIKEYNKKMNDIMNDIIIDQRYKQFIKMVYMEECYREEFGSEFKDDLKKDHVGTAERLRNMERKEWINE